MQPTPVLAAGRVRGQDSGTPTVPAWRARRLAPIPRSFDELRERDIWFVVGLIGVVLALMWVRHGGLAEEPVLAIGQATAIAGSVSSAG